MWVVFCGGRSLDFLIYKQLNYKILQLEIKIYIINNNY